MKGMSVHGTVETRRPGLKMFGYWGRPEVMGGVPNRRQ
jgi:hypothetical protein